MKDRYRNTELSFSFLILHLYGRADYADLKSAHSLSEAKKMFLKILKSFRFAIEETIQIVDKKHKQNLLETVNSVRDQLKSTNSFDELDQQMIAFQTNLIFQLIGGMPTRGRSKKVINRRDMWKLDLDRQIQYTQNVEQKKHMIFSAVQGKYQSQFPDWGDFAIQVYWKQCQNDPAKLVEWIRANHQDIYFDLF